MADRYEPKLSVRPMSERKPAAAPGADSDPLVELTRIVTGRTAFDRPVTAKNKTVPATGGGMAATNVAVATDLEAELLNDLQASFAAVRDAAPPPPPRPAPAPAATVARLQPGPAPAAQDQAPPPPRPIRPATVAPPKVDRITPAASAPVAAAPAAKAEPAPLPAPAPPRQPAAAQPAPPRQPAVAQAAPAPRAPAASERFSFFRSGKGPMVDLSHMQLRPTTAAEPETAAPQAGAAPSRFAPPRGAAAVVPPPEPEGDEAEFEPGFGEDAAGPDDFSLEDLAALPEYGEEGDLPPFPEEELAGFARRRSRVRIIVAALLAIVLAGGLGYVMLRDTSAPSSPPLITADTSPTKVPPDKSAVVDPQSKESYDRVDGTDKAGDTKLVTPGSDKIATIAPGGDDNNPISRVIIPGGPGFDTPPSDDGAAPPADDSADTSEIGPRKVRTLVVRPDGTIVTNGVAPAAAGTPPADSTPPPTADAATPPAADATPPAADPAPPAPRTTGMDTVLNGGGIPVDPDPLAAKPPTPPAGTVPAGDAPPPPAADAAPPPPAADAAPTPAPAPRPPAPTARPVKPTVVATTAAPAAPMELVPAKGSPAPAAGTPAPVPISAGGGILVQLSSQTSEDGARSTYRDMQRKFASILGPYQPDIQRADLGDRGVYYRVRVGPFSAADAKKLCADLKAAGGQCIIAR